MEVLFRQHLRKLDDNYLKELIRLKATYIDNYQEVPNFLNRRIKFIQKIGNAKFQKQYGD